jgi:hypothetical protein
MLSPKTTTFNYEHKEANSKTKQSTRNIKMPTPKQNNQPGAYRLSSLVGVALTRYMPPPLLFVKV